MLMLLVSAPITTDRTNLGQVAGVQVAPGRGQEVVQVAKRGALSGGAQAFKNTAAHAATADSSLVGTSRSPKQLRATR